MIGLVMMSALLTLTGGELPHTSDVYLLYPREVASSPVIIAESGAYTLWVCVAENADTYIEIAGTRHEAQPERGGERGAALTWRNLGATPLASGDHDISCGSDIAMIALTRQPGFEPEKALAHLRALPLPEAARDMRAERTRDTNTVFTMPRYETLANWEKTAQMLRNRILLGSGLYPLPEKTPLNARIFDEQIHDDYAVSNVHFEAWPGFLVTGNLYRPLGAGPFPGVVNPHGHWEAGRLEDSERCSVAARCITLARMGAVAFTYDMIGYVDSRQTPHNWGSPRENLWGIHTFGMQLWSGIRAVDFLLELPYVDPERIGCTGASGGGTQTFALTAVDARVRVAAPVNMVSSTMQGGCLCENAPILRLDNSNMEIGALAAPRPLLLVSTTGDWTRETPRVEYPAIRSIYALYGAADKVANAHFDYGHNYNLASREAMYRFFGEHLIGGQWDDFTEPDYDKGPDEALRVFPGDEPPEGWLRGQALRDLFLEQARERREARLPKDTDAATAWREQHGNAFGHLLGVGTPHPNDLRATRHSIDTVGDYILERWLFGRAAVGDEIPALLYRNTNAAPQDVAILVHGRGKAFFADIAAGAPGPLILALLEQGQAVLLIDPFLTGEHHAPDKVRAHQSMEKFHDTFHPTDTAHRVQDILTTLAFLRMRYDTTNVMDVIGVEAAGLWCLLAGAAEPAFRRIVVDMNQFDMTDDDAWLENAYMPGIRAIGDIPAAIAAGGPDRFVLYNARESQELDALGVYTTTSAQMPPL